MPPTQIRGHHLDAELEHLERLDEPLARGFVVTLHTSSVAFLERWVNSIDDRRALVAGSSMTEP